MYIPVWQRNVVPGLCLLDVGVRVLERSNGGVVWIELENVQSSLQILWDIFFCSITWGHEGVLWELYGCNGVGHHIASECVGIPIAAAWNPR
jgi:hypothetical protein